MAKGICFKHFLESPFIEAPLTTNHTRDKRQTNTDINSYVLLFGCMYSQQMTTSKATQSSPFSSLHHYHSYVSILYHIYQFGILNSTDSYIGFHFTIITYTFVYVPNIDLKKTTCFHRLSIYITGDGCVCVCVILCQYLTQQSNSPRMDV